MEAFRVPTLKMQLEKAKTETEESRLMTARLADALEERNKQVAVLETSISQLLDERNKQVAVFEEERGQFHNRITQLAEEHAHQIAKCKCLIMTRIYFFLNSYLYSSEMSAGGGGTAAGGRTKDFKRVSRKGSCC